jgi:hypothetical protein
MISTLDFNDIKIKNILFQHIGILTIGLLIFYVEKLEIASVFWEKISVILISIGKSIYFVEHSFKKIEEASVKNIGYNILLIVISFAADYFCLLRIDPHSFKGMAVDGWTTAFDSFYFSLVSFTTVAYGDIIPITKAAKSLTILEVIVAYVTTIIIISNFVQIKESIEKKAD